MMTSSLPPHLVPSSVAASLPPPPPPVFPQSLPPQTSQPSSSSSSALPPPPAPSFPQLAPPRAAHPQQHRLSDPFSLSGQFSALQQLLPAGGAGLPPTNAYTLPRAPPTHGGGAGGRGHVVGGNPYLDDPQFIDPGAAAAISVSPSQASLMSTGSHQSSGSSRSLSPPIGPAHSPAQSRAHLGSMHEVEQQQQQQHHRGEPDLLQEALANKLRMRAQTIGEPPGGRTPPTAARHGTTNLEAKPPVATPTSCSSQPVVRRGPPPVAHKPPRPPSGHGLPQAGPAAPGERRRLAYLLACYFLLFFLFWH